MIPPPRFGLPTLLVLTVGTLLGAASAAPATKPAWPPPGGVPMTPWGKEVAADKPVLPEYPRPQLVRERWLNLNGPWDYAVAPREAAAPPAYAGKILVPFPIESVLSGVNKRVDERSRLWYRRTFQIPADWAGQRVLLHFGAVDWEAAVSVNGKPLGTHRGGYDGFDFDVTDALAPAANPQELQVAVWDPTEGGQPQGKQVREPEGIFYTPSTGIWQTVWLEPVPPAHVESLKMVSDLDGGRLRLTAAAAGAGEGDRVEAVASAAGREVSRAAGKAGEPIDIAIPHARPWWPDDPFLYDLRVKLKRGDAEVDSVGSYFGMRKVSVGPDDKGVTRILLNNTFVLHNGLLDQGFWPDGLYTAPGDAALRYDLEMTRKLGFNMSRKHIKVEPDRWYYWADRLGVLVWQDMPAANRLTDARRGEVIPDRAGQFEREALRMIEGRFNHPSIVMWVLFNEGMGLGMGPGKPEKPSAESEALMRRITAAAVAADPTRLVDHESGAGGGAWQGMNPWDVGIGHVIDFHCYGKSNGPVPEMGRASVIGEYGYGVSPTGSVARELPEVMGRGVSGLVLTQLTDVENETNGALRYDRSVKPKNAPPDVVGPEIRRMTRPWTGPSSRPGGE